jgi:hypothetical protein
LAVEHAANIRDQRYDGERFGSAHALVGDIELRYTQSPGPMYRKIVGLRKVLPDLVDEDKICQLASRASRHLPAGIAAPSCASLQLLQRGS